MTKVYPTPPGVDMPVVPDTKACLEVPLAVCCDVLQAKALAERPVEAGCPGITRFTVGQPAQL